MVCFRLTTFHSGITLGQLFSLWLERGTGRGGTWTLTTNLKQLCKKFSHIEKFAQPQNTLENVWGVRELRIVLIKFWRIMTTRQM